MRTIEFFCIQENENIPLFTSETLHIQWNRDNICDSLQMKDTEE